MTGLLIPAASVPAAVLARVAVETTLDPTSHNLWPFELVIAGFVGGFCAGLGMLGGLVVGRLGWSRPTA